MRRVTAQPTLNVPQAKFLSLDAKFRLYIGGYGAGKTWALGANACQFYLQHPRKLRGYFAPTYTHIRDIYYPTIEEVAHDWGLRVHVRESNKEVDFYNGRRCIGTTICRSMEKPNTIVGFKIARGDVDEIDILPATKADNAWRKMIARLRQKFDGLNGLDVGTTPEGFGFAYKQFVERPTKDPALRKLYALVRASTYDNEVNLPADYIDSLLATYPPNLIQAYLEGLFVNMTTGVVYPQFNRRRNSTTETLKDKEKLHIGMDFNVGHMAAVTHVLRNEHDTEKRTLLAVDELIDYRDTPQIIQEIKERYWKPDPSRPNGWIKTREILIYPDASGGNTSSKNASLSDLTLLRDAGFTVVVNKTNPAVKDRVNAMNAAFLNAEGVVRYRVNIEECPQYVARLEQQAYDRFGNPDKKNNVDHPPDAAGYVVSKILPVTKRIALINTF